jgi:hypothetical protein
MEESRIQYAEWTLRIAMFATFLGHGIFALQQKTKFVEMLTAMTTIQQPLAGTIMVWIGVIDVLVAIAVLYKPLRVLLIWGALWAFLTAAARPVAGDPIWDFVERAANFGVPLALLYLRGLPRTWKEWFE